MRPHSSPRSSLSHALQRYSDELQAFRLDAFPLISIRTQPELHRRVHEFADVSYPCHRYCHDSPAFWPGSLYHGDDTSTPLTATDAIAQKALRLVARRWRSESRALQNELRHSIQCLDLSLKLAEETLSEPISALRRRGDPGTLSPYIFLYSETAILERHAILRELRSASQRSHVEFTAMTSLLMPIRSFTRTEQLPASSCHLYI